MGRWDGWTLTLLALELAELSDAGYGLALTGFADAEIEALLADADQLINRAAGDEAQDPADADSETTDEVPDAPVVPVSRTGDVWQLGDHRLICGDATDPSVIAALMQGAPADLCFTSPPYGNQRDYTSGGITDWDGLMRGVCANLPMADDGQVLVNLGLIHRDSGRRSGFVLGWLARLDAYPGLAALCLVRLGSRAGTSRRLERAAGTRLRVCVPFQPAEFHTPPPRRPHKMVSCLYAGRDTHLRGDGTSAGGMRNKNGSKTTWNHVGQVTQDTKIPDAVIRIMRHKGKIGVGIDHTAVFPMALPEFVIQAYMDAGDIVFEPFGGSGTTLLAAQRSGRVCRSVEIAPAYVDVAIKRFQQNFPEVPVILLGNDGKPTSQTFEVVATQRLAHAAVSP